MPPATSGEDTKVYCVKWESFPPGNVLVIYCVQPKEGITVYNYNNKNQSTKMESGPPEFQDESLHSSLLLRGVKVQGKCECHIETDRGHNVSSFTIVAEGPCPSINGSQAETTPPTSSSGSVSAIKWQRKRLAKTVKGKTTKLTLKWNVTRIHGYSAPRVLCCPLTVTQHVRPDVKEFPPTSLRMSITGLQLSESNNNKLYPTTSPRL
ncbi:hypothetical protein INR49_009433 [Caranx melampygus]|nr:hypothetical protein INR49_009433 [Caranx melampygus]